MLQEAVKTSNESNQNPIIKHGETRMWARVHKGDMFDHDDVTDSTRTGRPVLVDQKEEHKIDCRAPGLSCAVVKEAEHLRAQELVKKIENHLHREALHADLQQNNVYNPFSKKSKEMIRELSKVGLFELCETIPKVRCSHCLLYWNQGITANPAEHLTN